METANTPASAPEHPAPANTPASVPEHPASAPVQQPVPPRSEIDLPLFERDPRTVGEWFAVLAFAVLPGINLVYLSYLAFGRFTSPLVRRFARAALWLVLTLAAIGASMWLLFRWLIGLGGN